MRWMMGCAMMLLSAAPVMAVPVTYNLTGTVEQLGSTVLVPVVVGQTIPIVITVDDAYPQTSPGSGQYSFNGGNPTVGFIGPLITATFDGESLTGLFETISVSPSELSISTAEPQTGTGFQLNLMGPLASVGGAFPASIDQASLTSGTFSVNEAFGVQFYGYTGIIAGAQAAPEPASAALFGTGVLSLIWSAQRRRAAAQNAS